jgi:hypothetical protein
MRSPALHPFTSPPPVAPYCPPKCGNKGRFGVTVTVCVMVLVSVVGTVVVVDVPVSVLVGTVVVPVSVLVGTVVVPTSVAEGVSVSVPVCGAWVTTVVWPPPPFDWCVGAPEAADEDGAALDVVVAGVLDVVVAVDVDEPVNLTTANTSAASTITVTTPAATRAGTVAYHAFGGGSGSRGGLSPPYRAARVGSE